MPDVRASRNFIAVKGSAGLNPLQEKLTGMYSSVRYVWRNQFPLPIGKQIVSSDPLPIESCSDCESEMYKRFFERERAARKEAEQYLEVKSRELYLSNQKLAALAAELEEENKRTKADLERRKALESQLAHAQKMESVGQLAAGVAHELNTPIQFVGDNIDFLKSSFEDMETLLTAVESLLSDCREDERLVEQVDLIDQVRKKIEIDFLRDEVPLAADQALEGTRTLTRIVKAMKVFSHPGTKSFEEVDLNQLVESMLDVSRSEWKYHATLVTDLCDDLPLVNCVPGELGQALLNLIVNAANAMADDKSGLNSILSVRTRREGNDAIVEISDTGCGIPDEIKHRVFDPFFTTKSVGEGTGQGLSISYRIVVKLHKGTLSFDSVVGEGTTFRICLPLDSDITTAPNAN